MWVAVNEHCNIVLNFYSTVHVPRSGGLAKYLLSTSLVLNFGRLQKKRNLKQSVGLSVFVQIQIFWPYFTSHGLINSNTKFPACYPLLTHNLTHYLLRKYNGGKNLNMSLNMTSKFISICLAQIATWFM